MEISYQSIYSRFLQKVTDYELAQLSQDDAYEMMCGWLHSTLSRPYVRSLFSELYFKDDTLIINCSLSNSVGDNADTEFIIELAAMGMVVEWLEPRVKATTNIAQMFGGKEQKFYAQSTHMAELKSMLEDARIEFRKMIRDYGYIHNSYIGGD